MAIAISPVSVPPAAVQSGSAPAAALVLQPGTVIDARVLAVLDASLVRILIADTPIDVLSQVPLQAGAALRLAVSQTAGGGVQLAIVPPDAGGAAEIAAPVSTTGGAAFTPATDTSAIARPVAVGDLVSTPVLTPAQAAAVNTAAQAAASRQGGLSPLFANVAAALNTLPAPLQQVAAQLLAARPALTPALAGTEIQSAFQNSGLFLEARLASGVPLPGQAGGPPDLKAALLVFRQLLSAYADETGAAASTEAINPAAAVGAAPDAATHGPGAGPASAASVVPQQGTEGTLGSVVMLAGEGAQTARNASTSPGGAGEALLPAGATVLSLFQEAGGTLPPPLGGAAVPPDRTGADATTPGFHGVPVDAPPPPYRGAAPVPQPVASPSIAPDAAPHEIVRHLADDIDGAIARQTLLQIASLPGRDDTAGIDRAVPRWNFEIPFATPQGTAVAQFEISGDGGGQAVAPSQRAWRARFTINVEPAGPVHAVVSLAGGTTSVRMWAERPQTATRLRANASQLSVALRQADLEPGDIVIGDGAPPQPVHVAPAGHFLDRAT